MKDLSLRLKDVFTRYGIMILLSISGLWIFYFIFTPLTVYPVYYLINIFFNAVLHYSSRTIFIFGELPTIFGSIELIEACIAGSAYYLLTILNLSTPKLKLRKRVKILLWSFALLLIINILRIFILSVMFVNGSSLFDATHKAFWYLGNIIFVVGIWFYEVKKFKIKGIPFYSDLMFFTRLRKKSYHTQSRKKNKNSGNRNTKSNR